MRGISLFIAGAILLARALPVAVAFLSATSSIGLPRASPLSCASFLGSDQAGLFVPCCTVCPQPSGMDVKQVCPCRVTHKPGGGCSTTGASVGILVSCSHSADWGSCSPAGESPAARLRAKLATKQILTMPCCFDALSARLIERAGFEITFMSGFSTSAAKAWAA